MMGFLSSEGSLQRIILFLMTSRLEFEGKNKTAKTPSKLDLLPGLTHGCVTLRKLFNLSVHQALHCLNELE